MTLSFLTWHIRARDVRLLEVVVPLEDLAAGVSQSELSPVCRALGCGVAITASNKRSSLWYK